MSKRRLAMILIIVCLYLMPCKVQAASTADAKEFISTDTLCTLGITYSSNGTSFSDLPIRLYKIAEVSSDFQYTLAPAYKASNLIINGIRTVGEWDVIRSTLETYIIANGIRPESVILTDEYGEAHFGSLLPGLYLAVTDRVVQNETTYTFESALMALPNLNNAGFWQYSLEVTPKSRSTDPSEPDKVIELDVIKLWKGDSDKNVRPQSIEVEIFRNGESYKTVELSKDNNWKYSWTAEDDGSVWKVFEQSAPAGYTMTVDERETSFIITNTFNYEEPDTPPSPPTGDTSNTLLYIILMNISGITLIILGIRGKRKNV